MSETQMKPTYSQLEADSKKLWEPATCNAGHKSNLPLALWDCPVCTQLLRDQIQRVKDEARELADMAYDFADIHPDSNDAALLRSKARAVESALGGKAE